MQGDGRDLVMGHDGDGTDCLFLHVPKWSNEYLPLGEFMNVTFMPMGLPALAELLRRQERSTEILHLGVEWMVDPEWRVADEVARRRPRAVGIPLHWHYQSHDAIEVARAVKRVSPESFVFLGGITASYFAREILEDHAFVDGVVEGFGERALPALMEVLAPSPASPQGLAAERLDLGRVPGLWWRDGAIPRRNEIPTAPETGPDAISPVRAPGLDELVFGDLSTLRHAELYARHFGFPLAFSKEYDGEEHRRHQTMGRAFFPLCVGRGCPVSCSYCGGNRRTLSRIGQGGVHWRSHDAVLADMQRIWDFGYRTASLCFDPTPADPSWYVDLFARMRGEAPPIDLYFETWGLPTREFMEAFARFSPEHSTLAYSPDTGSDALRLRNKGYPYETSALRASLDLAETLHIAYDVFFTLALPGETLAEAMETRDLMDEIRRRAGRLRRLMVWTVQLEPGSPQFENPEAWGIESARRRFADFHALHGGTGADTYHSLGYRIPGYFGDERDEGGIPGFEAAIQHLKCMSFCHLADDPRDHPSPAEGRAHCLERRRRLARRRGVSTAQSLIGDDHRYAAALEAMRGPGGRGERGGFV